MQRPEKETLIYVTCKRGMCLMMPATKRGIKGPYRCVRCGAKSPGFMGRKYTGKSRNPNKEQAK